MLSQRELVIVTAVVGAVVVAAVAFLGGRNAPETEPGDQATEVDPFADGFPVPPLPGQTVTRSRGTLGERPTGSDTTSGDTTSGDTTSRQEIGRG